MNILVTGATGFLGRNVYEYFSDMPNNKVVCTGRREMTFDKADYFKMDLSEIDSFSQLDKETNVIIHCAALSDDWASYEDYYKNNVVATQNLISYAKKCPQLKRFIYISTPSIYFNCNSENNVREEDVFPTKGFVNNYAKTKYMAELDTIDSGIPYTILRPRAIYGPYDTSVLVRLLELNEKIGIPIIKDGSQEVDMVYVGNLIHAIDLVINNGNSRDKIFNVTDDNPMPIKKVYGLLEKHLDTKIKLRSFNYQFLMSVAKIFEKMALTFDKRPIVTRYAISVIGNSQTLSIEKIKTDLDYQPKFSTEEGVAIYATWRKCQNSSNRVL